MNQELKALLEKFNQKQNRLTEILEKAKEEVRALNDEEMTEFNEVEKEAKALLFTINKMQEERAELVAEVDVPAKTESLEDLEIRAFDNYLRGIVEEVRGDNDAMAKATNGAVIPTTIANKIVEKIKNFAPLYELTTNFNAEGTLNIPTYDETNGSIQVAWQANFSKATPKNAVFKSIALNTYMALALVKIEKSLVSNVQFDLVGYVVNKMAEAIAFFIENLIINGESGKCTGIIDSKNVITNKKLADITLEEITDLYSAVPAVVRKNAVWVMNPKTMALIRRMKDGEGRPLLNQDVTKEFGYTLFGRPVFETDNMKEVTAQKVAIAFGDMKGIYTNSPARQEIEILREKYADEGAIGVIGYLEFGCQLIESQRIAVLKMASA